ncbi:MAG: hypothetical protein IPN77_33285 [Sandaracinaceae bacterium]|nr:hypothetical protein [Sandaracinaceae bacterium]
MTGNPAINLPVLVNGRPLGVPLVGRRGDDGRLLALSRTVLGARNLLVTLPGALAVNALAAWRGIRRRVAALAALGFLDTS